MNANDLVGLIKDLQTDQKAFSLGTIDPNYDGGVNGSGLPKVIFDGEDTPSLKGYPFVSGYQPMANERVLLANVGGSHVIFGRAISNPEVGCWHDITLPSGWTNFGGGYHPAQYMKTSYNTLKIRGLVKPVSTFSIGTIFTLPSGFRPKLATITNSVYKKSDSTIQLWQMTIGADGNVSSSSFTGITSGMLWLNLDAEVDLK